MAEAYIGEIRLFAGNFAPYGWAFCEGQLLSIAQNTALYSILGTQYGGDGRTNFALPNLRGRAPMNQGTGPGLTPRQVGDTVGSNTVTLDMRQIPQHTHVARGINKQGTSGDPANHYWAETVGGGRGSTQSPLYNATASVAMHPDALGKTGGNQPHNNMQPFLAINYIICLNGEFPVRN